MFAVPLTDGYLRWRIIRWWTPDRRILGRQTHGRLILGKLAFGRRILRKNWFRYWNNFRAYFGEKMTFELQPFFTTINLTTRRSQTLIINIIKFCLWIIQNRLRFATDISMLKVKEFPFAKSNIEQVTRLRCWICFFNCRRKTWEVIC